MASSRGCKVIEKERATNKTHNVADCVTLAIGPYRNFVLRDQEAAKKEEDTLQTHRGEVSESIQPGDVTE
jgi:hypothetical protein